MKCLKKIIVLFVFTISITFIINERVNASIVNDDISFEPLFGGGYLEPIDDGGDDEENSTITLNLPSEEGKAEIETGYYNEYLEYNSYEFISPHSGYYIFDIEAKEMNSITIPFCFWIRDYNNNTMDSANNYIHYADNVYLQQGKKYTFFIQHYSYVHSAEYGKYTVKIIYPKNLSFPSEDSILVSSGDIDFTNDSNYYSFTPGTDVVLRFYSEGHNNIKVYLYNESGLLLTYDTIGTSQLNIYYALSEGASYVLQVKGGSVGSYSISVTKNIGLKIIEENARSFSESVVYVKSNILPFDRAEGYFHDPEDANAFIDYFYELTIFEEYIVPSCVCFGATLANPGSWVTPVACSLMFYNLNRDFQELINSMKQIVNDINGPVYLSLGENIMYNMPDPIIAPWDTKTYMYSELFTEYNNLYIDTNFYAL